VISHRDALPPTAVLRKAVSEHFERTSNVALQATERGFSVRLGDCLSAKSLGSSPPVSVPFGDPVSELVLFVLLLDGASGYAVGAILFAVLFLCGVEHLFSFYPFFTLEGA
jgi:hypothetical protein